MLGRSWNTGVVCGLVVIVLNATLAGCGSIDRAPPPATIISNAQVGGSVLAFDRGSTRLALGDWQGDIALWKLPHGEPLQRWRAHHGTVNGLAFLAEDRRLLSAGYDGDLAEWDARGQLLRRVPTGSPVTAMTVSAADDTVITGHADGSVRMWALAALKPRSRHEAHSGAVRAVAYLPERRWLASSGTDTRVYFWKDADAPPAALPGPPSDSRALQFSPDGRWLLGSGWFRLFRWDLDRGGLVTLPTEHHGVIKSLHLSADGRHLASISRKTDSAVYFLDPLSGRTLRRFQRHELCGAWIALSPDGSYLATTSDDASVRVWRLGQTSP